MYASLTISLLVASVAMLGKQWLNRCGMWVGQQLNVAETVSASAMDSQNGHSIYSSKTSRSCSNYPFFSSPAGSAGTFGQSILSSHGPSPPSLPSEFYFTSELQLLAYHHMRVHSKHQHQLVSMVHGRSSGTELSLSPFAARRCFHRPTEYGTGGPGSPPHHQSPSTASLESAQVHQPEPWLEPTDLVVIQKENTTDVRCVSWMLRNITDPEALDAAIRFAATVRWFEDGVNFEPPYDLIVSVLEGCFDSTASLYPGLAYRGVPLRTSDPLDPHPCDVRI